MNIPYGWREENRELVPVPEEQVTLEKIHFWRKANVDRATIVQLLKARRAPLPVGGVWTENVIKHMLSRNIPGMKPEGWSPASLPEPQHVVFIPADASVGEMQKIYRDNRQ